MNRVRRMAAWMLMKAVRDEWETQRKWRTRCTFVDSYKNAFACALENISLISLIIPLCFHFVSFNHMITSLLNHWCTLMCDKPSIELDWTWRGSLCITLDEAGLSVEAAKPPSHDLTFWIRTNAHYLASVAGPWDTWYQNLWPCSLLNWPKLYI